MQDFEKLGVFYLGTEIDQATGKPTDELLLYDSKDLTTHAVIIGMTGSGKTGLAISLLEEAAMDHIPVIAIDPKGDLANIMLTFPNLDAASFLPWLPPQDPGAAPVPDEQRAAELAEKWRKGLEGSGQDGARIGKMRQAVDMAVYTPGSSAGIPISVLRSFTAPPAELLGEADLYRERVQATAQGVLTLMGLDVDPLTSREHVLVSNILDHAWQQGQDLDIAGLIRGIQQPPFQQIGVLDLESFYPSKDRSALAMQLNNLLAAPGFAAWMQGQPLDVSHLFFGANGKPQISVMSIAHLGDRERMFFVSTLLNEIVAWMRTQPGTSSLRAIVYMDEMFGYLPPTANPPTKPLFLTLLKQARAFGLGLVLSTQNPVDLDYKAISNAGTWFIGRLQTEQDKARVMDGLQGASGAGFDRATIEKILAGLGKRIFLLHSVHENAPTIFTTRWAMSYLAGPMTREQIKLLKQTNPVAQPVASVAPATPASAAVMPKPVPVPQSAVPTMVSGPPILPAAIKQYFLPAMKRGAVEYRAGALASADVSYSNSKYGVQTARRIMLVTPIHDSAVPVDWAQSVELPLGPNDLDTEPLPDTTFGKLPPAASDAKRYPQWEKTFEQYIRTDKPLNLMSSPTLKVTSQVGEDERNFRIRLAQLAREARDAQIQQLRERYEPKIAALQDRLARAEATAERERSEARTKQLSSALQIGGALLGGLFGGRKTTSLSRAARGIGTMGRDTGLGRAEDSVADVQNKLADLQAEAQHAISTLETSFDNQAEALDQVPIAPKSSDIHTHFVALAWVPFVDGKPAW